MNVRLVACLWLVLAFIAVPFYSSHAQEVIVPSGAKVTDPTPPGFTGGSLI
ncbi:MAG: hypothetical protein AB1553_12315 [Nitrospirota bacterium]